MGTIVYIDGFNLYYGALKYGPHRWLDLAALCATLLPGRTIKTIRYFTATVVDYPHDPYASIRQEVYLRALGTLPNVVIHREGWFSKHAKMLPQYPLAYRNNPTKPPISVQVWRLEEKRTDVDLATHLLVDCFSGDFDEAVVISNDSDLTLPIEMVRNKFKKRIGVINPQAKSKMNNNLRNAASYHYQKISRVVLGNCQLPTNLTDNAGLAISKPAAW